MPNVSKEHKNNVFCMLYQDKRYLLSLYNAINGSDYQNEDDLQVVTLEHSICLSMKNDAAFLIDSQLNLYEHQSSVNDNLPLRDLYYVVEEYKKIVPPSELNHQKKLQIPPPHFVVFYNGTTPQPEKRVLRLSNLYKVQTDSPELELVVTQYNINAGYNKGIMEKCESLQGYMVFVDKVRHKTGAGLNVERAVAEAVNECIAEGILADFFRERKNEVVEMGIYEFDAEVYEKIIREESWEDGLEAGRKEGRKIGFAEGETLTLIKLICRKLAKGKSVETIAEELEEDPELIRGICAAAANYAPEYNPRKILEEYKLTSTDGE